MTPLARLEGDVWLKLREFRRISSDSVQKWIDLVRAMPSGGRLHLIECPIPFIHQANLITNLLERQEVESFFAPYSCAACGLDEERLVDVQRDLDGGKRRTPPAQKCSSCGGAARLRRARRAVLRVSRSLNARSSRAEKRNAPSAVSRGAFVCCVEA